LLAALSYAFAGIFGRFALKGVPVQVSATGQLITGALMLLPLAALQVPTAFPSWQAIGALTALAFAGTALASMMFYWLLMRVGATGTLLVTYLLPGFALFWGAIFLQEQVTLLALGGLVLVLVGITISSGTGATLVAWLERRGRGPLASSD
jgi:drug/metabolite transporter (DMT)-like permease